MFLTSIAVLVSLALVFYWASLQSYQTLMTGLNPEDSANIIRILREKKIPFKVENGGKSISIPPESTYQLRLELATIGLPQASVVGYEIFDNPSLGTTSFVQKVNRKRALEGELMRTINTIKGVKRTRVHLAMPRKSTFVEDHVDPTASVVIDLEKGFQLSESRIYGVQNLVSSAVEGLEIADVVIVDSGGRTLSKNTRDPLVALAADQFDFKKKIEEEFESRIIAMLSPIVGDGKVVAKVTAEIDFSDVVETQTLYDGDGAAVRSSQKNVMSMNGSRPSPYGKPGAASNTPGEVPAENGAKVVTDTKKDRIVTQTMRFRKLFERPVSLLGL